ncbi:hypothetical protein EV144_1011416 [Flavobacterium sp. 270]|uniref:hypothetical protein n=1 Tax=Flavobacterium sp. 270 TaxID=2512114 RepID=UPI001066C276|nr:hypothetical protein [Flavobacterium sp. 270]TDW52724.1 hypothetical protein EV144_1011416 [Flavobacterium sp. 270]
MTRPEAQKKNNFFIIVYIISFIITWIYFIFSYDKNKFDLEFSKKKTTYGTVFYVGSEEVVEELYEGRKTNVYNVNYIEYFYNVDGKKIKNGIKTYWKKYSISDKIEIEYVVNGLEIIKIKGQDECSFNYFIRNLLPVSMVSLLIMICFFRILDFFPKLKIYS